MANKYNLLAIEAKDHIKAEDELRKKIIDYAKQILPFGCSVDLTEGETNKLLIENYRIEHEMFLHSQFCKFSISRNSFQDVSDDMIFITSEECCGWASFDELPISELMNVVELLRNKTMQS